MCILYMIYEGKRLTVQLHEIFPKCGDGGVQKPAKMELG
jgi:hypothetical protein